MNTCRPVQTEDFAVISSFPKDRNELYYLFPSAVYPLTGEQLAENASKRHHPTVVLDEQAQVVGYANMYDLEAGEHCWLGNVIIAPEARGSGAAETLIRHMFQLAKDSLGAKQLRLYCHNTNGRGLLFYKRLGMIPFDLKKMIGPDGEPLVGILMYKDLESLYNESNS